MIGTACSPGVTMEVVSDLNKLYDIQAKQRRRNEEGQRPHLHIEYQHNVREQHARDPNGDGYEMYVIAVLAIVGARRA